MTFDDGTPKTITTGFTLQDLQVIGNSDDGIELDGVTATDVTFKGDTIAENDDDGVLITDSDVTDFAIQNSYLGAAPNFDGNGGAGFNGVNSTFTGVAFLNSFFNENGFDGILLDTSTIKSGTVTFNDGMPETLLTGLTVGIRQAVGNSDNGILVFDSTAADVTLDGDTIAENIGDGVFIFDSDISDFAIQNSYLGARPERVRHFRGRRPTSSIEADGSTFTGVTFLNSFFDANGTSGLGLGGRHFLHRRDPCRTRMT